jgi:hypothetical protein
MNAYPKQLTAFLGGALLLLCVTQVCYAAHWQAVGPPGGGAPGQVYMDMDSVREEQGFRVALFLTLYTGAMPNSHGIKLDRITQETAFDCKQREFALLETIGYYQGKKAGGSSDKGGEWKDRLRVVPQDPFSQRALDLACNAPLAPQPEPESAAADAPGSVRLPGPGGSISGGTAPAPAPAPTQNH